MDSQIVVSSTVFGLLVGAAIGFAGTTAILVCAVIRLRNRTRKGE